MTPTPIGRSARTSLSRTFPLQPAYGTDREHLSFGYSFGAGESPRRHGAWIEAGATP